MITDPGAQRVGAFIIVTLFLIIAADIEATQTLAVAFAYLILLSALFAKGTLVFQRLTAATEK